MKDKPQHYLKVWPVNAHLWGWECICGHAKGSGPTEAACEFSWDRHMVWVDFQRRKGKL